MNEFLLSALKLIAKCIFYIGKGVFYAVAFIVFVVAQIVLSFLEPESEQGKPVRLQKHSDPRLIPFDRTPLSERRGWTQNGENHKGYYRTTYGAWRGEITRKGDRFRVFIFDPPVAQLKTHSRWSCFRKEVGHNRPGPLGVWNFSSNEEKYSIHLALNPADKRIDSIILMVEEVICESFQQEVARTNVFEEEAQTSI